MILLLIKLPNLLALKIWFSKDDKDILTINSFPDTKVTLVKPSHLSYFSTLFKENHTQFGEDGELDFGTDVIAPDDGAAKDFVVDDEILVHLPEFSLNVCANSIGDLDVLSDYLIFHMFLPLL